MKQMRKQISFNTLDRLRKKQLGTEDVEQMSKKFIKTRPETWYLPDLLPLTCYL